MPEQHHHLANKYEGIFNLQGAEAYCVATRIACLYSLGGRQLCQNSELNALVTSDL